MKHIRSLTILVLSSLVAVLVSAAGGPEKIKMNGIALDDYGDFSKNWKLVTVRFRLDSHEMRFTYANDTAWAAMKKGLPQFPEGSVFAKIGYKSGVDPAFNSSVVPSGARRFQFMVKDKAKFSDTDGWGYALFTSSGELFEGNEKVVTHSCHACHRFVPEKDFVFSESIETSPLISHFPATHTMEKNKGKLTYEKLDKKMFAGKLKSHNSEMKLKNIEIISGPIRDYYFSGTLDEVTPLLINNLIQSNTPSGFVSMDQNTFKIVTFFKKGKCPDDSYSLLIYEARTEWKGKLELKTDEKCYAKTGL